jgi:hypothetical protein
VFRRLYWRNGWSEMTLAGARSASDPPAPATQATALPEPACRVGQNYTVVFAIDIVSALPPSGA